jgi:hypothetical protein
MARSESGPLTRRQRSLARALKPGVAPLRKLILAGEYLPEPATQAFRELKLSPNSDTDWKVLAVLVAANHQGHLPGPQFDKPSFFLRSINASKKAPHGFRTKMFAGR